MIVTLIYPPFTNLLEQSSSSTQKKEYNFDLERDVKGQLNNLVNLISTIPTKPFANNPTQYLSSTPNNIDVHFIFGRPLPLRECHFHVSLNLFSYSTGQTSTLK